MTHKLNDITHNKIEQISNNNYLTRTENSKEPYQVCHNQTFIRYTITHIII